MEDEFLSIKWDRDSSPQKAPQTPRKDTPTTMSPQEGMTPIKEDALLSIEAKSPEYPKKTENPISDYTPDEDPSIYINSTVLAPQKEGEGQNAYVSYLVETHTNNPVFTKRHLRVRRRFSDFYFLYRCLVNDYPACALPPLPDKKRLNYLKGDRFGYDFMAKRRLSLERFLQRMSQHPVLKRAKIYHIFLESTDWNLYKESLSVAHVKDPGAGDMGRETLGPSLLVLDTLSDLFMNAFKHPQAQPNKEFVEIGERCNKLNDNVVKIDRSFQKYTKRLGDLSLNFQVFSELLVKLDNLEASSPFNEEGVVAAQPEVRHVPLVGEESDLGMKNSADIASDKVSSYKKFGKGLENLAFGLSKLRRYLDNEYLILLKDLENYILLIKSLMRAKEQKQMDFEALSEYLARAIHEKNLLLEQTGATPISGNEELTTPHSTTTVAEDPSIQLPTPHPSTLTSLALSTSNFLSLKIDNMRGINSAYQKKERLIKLSVKIETLEREVVNAKKIFEMFENEMLHEVQYFDVIKSNEMKGNLKELSGRYVDFYKGLISDWEKIEASLEREVSA